MNRSDCPCRKNSCPRHGDCETCREHHTIAGGKRPVFCERSLSIRRFRRRDAQEVSEVICTTLTVSNSQDYPTEFIRENIESHSPEVILQRAEEAHFYVVTQGRRIIGCGGITGYWGSTTESYLVSIFVLPTYQHRGIGRKIMETLEADEYFQRAWRTEVGSSLTAVAFYRKLGYVYKNGITTPDEYGVIRLEKRKENQA